MDPEKRFTCAQLLQHPYFDGFTNEFEREKKEQIKHLHREQQKLIQQQAKMESKRNERNQHCANEPGRGDSTPLCSRWRFPESAQASGHQPTCEWAIRRCRRGDQEEHLVPHPMLRDLHLVR